MKGLATTRSAPIVQSPKETHKTRPGHHALVMIGPFLVTDGFPPSRSRGPKDTLIFLRDEVDVGRQKS